MFKNKIFIEKIIFNFSVLLTGLKLKSKIGLLDDNIFSEYLFCHILNLIYDLELININKEKSNYPAIDLHDKNRRIAYQITTTNTKQKIQKTLDIFNKNQFYNNYNRLVFLILTQDDLRLSKTIEKNNNFEFIFQRDIININTLLHDIISLDFNTIKEISDFLDKEIQQITSEELFNDFILKSDKNKELFNDFMTDFYKIRQKHEEGFNKMSLYDKTINLNGQNVENKIISEQKAFISLYKTLSLDFSIYFISNLYNLYYKEEQNKIIKDTLKAKISNEIDNIKIYWSEPDSKMPVYIKEIVTKIETTLFLNKLIL